MPTYQTDELQRYERRFVQVAEDLFDRVRREIPAQQTERHKGSFSIYAQTSKETAAKIMVYDPMVGKSGRDWPAMRDGVYIWVRANGLVGAAIWDDILSTEMPWIFRRLRREITVQIAANPQTDFAFFPVMAGDDFDDLASFLVACARA